MMEHKDVLDYIRQNDFLLLIVLLISFLPSWFYTWLTMTTMMTIFIHTKELKKY
jgi:hypothetical protein